MTRLKSFVFLAVYCIGLLTLPLYHRLIAPAQPQLPRPNATGKYSPMVPAYYAAARASFAALLPAAADLVFLGDSRIRHGLWNDRFPGRRVLNRGIDGDTCGGVIDRINADVPLDAQMVVVEVGVNDLAQGATAEQVADGLREVVAKLRGRRCHHILLCSVVPVTAAYDSTPHLNARIARVNAALSQFEAPDVRIVDLAALSPDGSLEPKLSWDGVHFNEEVYHFWCERLQVELAKAQ